MKASKVITSCCRIKVYATGVANQSGREAVKSATRANGKKLVSDRLMTVTKGDPLNVSQRRAEGDIESRGQRKLTLSRGGSHYKCFVISADSKNRKPRK